MKLHIYVVKYMSRKTAKLHIICIYWKKVIADLKRGPKSTESRINLQSYGKILHQTRFKKLQ